MTRLWMLTLVSYVVFISYSGCYGQSLAMGQMGMFNRFANPANAQVGAPPDSSLRQFMGQAKHLLREALLKYMNTQTPQKRGTYPNQPVNTGLRRITGQLAPTNEITASLKRNPAPTPTQEQQPTITGSNQHARMAKTLSTRQANLATGLYSLNNAAGRSQNVVNPRAVIVQIPAEQGVVGKVHPYHTASFRNLKPNMVGGVSAPAATGAISQNTDGSNVIRQSVQVMQQRHPLQHYTSLLQQQQYPYIQQQQMQVDTQQQLPQQQQLPPQTQLNLLTQQQQQIKQTTKPQIIPVEQRPIQGPIQNEGISPQIRTAQPQTIPSLQLPNAVLVPPNNMARYFGAFPVQPNFPPRYMMYKRIFPANVSVPSSVSRRIKLANNGNIPAGWAIPNVNFRNIHGHPQNSIIAAQQERVAPDMQTQKSQNTMSQQENAYLQKKNSNMQIQNANIQIQTANVKNGNTALQDKSSSPKQIWNRHVMNAMPNSGAQAVDPSLQANYQNIHNPNMVPINILPNYNSNLQMQPLPVLSGTLYNPPMTIAEYQTYMAIQNDLLNQLGTTLAPNQQAALDQQMAWMYPMRSYRVSAEGARSSRPPLSTATTPVPTTTTLATTTAPNTYLDYPAAHNNPIYTYYG